MGLRVSSHEDFKDKNTAQLEWMKLQEKFLSEGLYLYCHGYQVGRAVKLEKTDTVVKIEWDCLPMLQDKLEQDERFSLVSCSYKGDNNEEKV